MSEKRSRSPAYQALGVQARSARLAALLAEGPGLRRKAGGPGPDACGPEPDDNDGGGYRGRAAGWASFLSGSA